MLEAAGRANLYLLRAFRLSLFHRLSVGGRRNYFRWPRGGGLGLSCQQQRRTTDRQASRDPLGDRKRQTEGQCLLVIAREFNEKACDRAQNQIQPNDSAGLVW